MKHVATAAALCLLALASADAQENRSLTNSGTRPLNGGYLPQATAGGTRVSLPGSSEETEDIADLRERLILSGNAIRQLTDSLAKANAEAETYKRQAADLLLKLQTLGLDRDPEVIEQRLLQAVRDLRIAKKENEDFRSVLIQLSESVLALLKSTDKIGPEYRMAVEEQMRRANEILGAPTNAAAAEAVEPTLQDAMIVDVKDELSLVVANVGEKHGVKYGMPFQVWRDGKKIGEVTVVNMKSRICGAIIQNLENPKNPVQAGDRLRVDAQRPPQ